MSVAVLEVRRIGDGVWEAPERAIRAGVDIDLVEDLASRPSEEALVRVGGALRKLTVYLEEGEGGLVSFAEAYGATS